MLPSRFVLVPSPLLMKAAMALAVLAGTTAHAAQVATDAELQLILGDQAQLEDFEGINLAGGTTVASPNPLNAGTAPAGWGILPGVSYLSGNSLGFFGGSLLGNDSVILGGSPALNSVNKTITVSFATPQLAVGFYVLNTTGNLSFLDSVTFFSNSTVLGTLNLALPTAGAKFAGWQDAAGITSARITSNQWALVDNVAWGVSAVPELPNHALLGLGLFAVWAKHRSQRGTKSIA